MGQVIGDFVPRFIGTWRFEIRSTGVGEVQAYRTGRRTYTQSHIDFVAEVVIDVAMGAGDIGGYRIVEQAPWLRHFTAKFEPV